MPSLLQQGIVLVNLDSPRRSAEDLVVRIFGGQAPRRVLVFWLCTALGTALAVGGNRTLQAARFFEAAMASLLHGTNSLTHPGVARPARIRQVFHQRSMRRV